MDPYSIVPMEMLRDGFPELYKSLERKGMLNNLTSKLGRIAAQTMDETSKQMMLSGMPTGSAMLAGREVAEKQMLESIQQMARKPEA